MEALLGYFVGLQVRLSMEFVEISHFKIDSAYGTLIKKELISAIAYLCSTYPLRVSLFFPSVFLEVFSVDKELDCTNLFSTDLFFNSIKLHK